MWLFVNFVQEMLVGPEAVFPCRDVKLYLVLVWFVMGVECIVSYIAGLEVVRTYA